MYRRGVALLLTAVVAVLAGLLLGWALWRWRKGPGGRARHLRTELDRTTASLAARTADLETTAHELAEARRSADAVAAELAHTTEDRRGLEVELRAARTRLAAADATVEALRVRLAEARSAHGAALAAQRSALGERDAAMREMAELREAHDELRVTVARLEQEHACAQAARCAAVHQRDEARAAHAAAVGELASLEERVRTYRADRDAAESRRRDLEQQVAAHRSAAVEADARIVAAETEAHRVTREYAGLLMEREALAGDCDELERRLAALEVIDLRDAAGEGPTASVLPDLPSASVPPSAPAARPERDGDDLKAIPGIGPVTEAMLRAQGIRTYSDLAALDDAALDRLAETVPVLADHGRRTAWVTEAARLASVLVTRRS